MEKKVIFRNITCSVLLQFVTILSGFVVPKIILSHFGSEINGLISSINQFLNYIQLLEGGLSSVIMAALYKPLAEKDVYSISRVIKAAQLFFRKIAIIFVVYMFAVAIVYPLIIDTEFSYLYLMLLIIVLGSHLFIQYFFSLTWKLLLNADRRVYIVSITQIIVVILNMVVVVICSRIFHDILALKIASAAIYVIQPLIYGFYIRKHYYIQTNIEPDNTALSQRWSGFGINLAYFVHTNTDVVILTLFSSLTNVSVYSVYLLVINAMKNFVMSISQAIMPSFGKVIVTEDNATANDRFEMYEFGIYFVSSIIFTCGLLLITPFVKVYTANIHDANYEQYAFGYLLTVAEMIYCYRDSYVAAAYSAGHFKQVTKYAVIEALLNLFLSLMLVRRFGIVGVAIGTLVSMIYRGIAHVIYLRDNILMREPMLAVKKAAVFAASILFTVIISHSILTDSAGSYLQWLVLAIKEVVITVLVVSAAATVFFKNDFQRLLNSSFGRLIRR